MTNSLPEWLYQFMLLPTVYETFSYFTSLPSLVLPFFFILVVLVGMYIVIYIFYCGKIYVTQNLSSQLFLNVQFSVLVLFNSINII